LKVVDPDCQTYTVSVVNNLQHAMISANVYTEVKKVGISHKKSIRWMLDLMLTPYYSDW